MKTHVSWTITVIIVMILTMNLSLPAQVPQSFSYQAIVRDTGGEPIADQAVAIRIKLHQGSDAGTVVYSESHSVMTSPLGLVNLEVGKGTIISGSFSAINWETGVYYVELELDPAGGTNYVSMGTAQLLSVPYALFSEKTGQEYTAGSGIGITDNLITNIAPDMLVTLSNGTGINVTGAYPDFSISNTTPDQVVSLTPGAGISTGGTYPDFTVTNTAPNANHTGDASGSEALTVSAIQGRPVSAAAPATEQVLQWNGSQWIPATVSSGDGTNSWSLTGNSGTNPAVNFLGTTDNQPLKFRVNTQAAGEINPGKDNTFLGMQAGGNAIGIRNVAIGSGALSSIVGNSRATAIGYGAMYYADNYIAGWETYNTAVGYEALKGSNNPLNNAGRFNTGLGDQALSSNTLGDGNTAVGCQSLCSNASGSYNNAVGYKALYTNTSGVCNNADGYEAMTSNTSGSHNTATGYWTLYSNTTGNENTACGERALYSNKGNYRSTAIGFSAMANADNRETNPITTYNTAVGALALRGSLVPAANTGVENTALGDMALLSNSSGTKNTALGRSALFNNSSGSSNIAAGIEVLASNTAGSYNTGIGHRALFLNTSGSSNVAVGPNALYNCMDRSKLVAVGDSALFNNGIGALNPPDANWNTALGSKALYANTTGCGNTAVGYQSLINNTSGHNNIAVGQLALATNSEGVMNIGIGNYALQQLSTGDSNVAIGHFAGWATNLENNTSVGFCSGDWFQYSNSTFLGAKAYTTGTGAFDNCMALGFDARVDASNKVLIGNINITSIGGYAGWTNFSDGRFKKNVREDVPGLDFIRRLRPVTYTLDITSLDADLNKIIPATFREGEQTRTLSTKERAGMAAKEKIVYTGFIAQEVEASARAIGYDFSGVDAPQNPDGHYGLRYAEFVVPLVKAIQEQQAMIEELQKEVKRLKEEKQQ
ncbi:MAG TPA: tail fiber domain-containing protein [Bacteroidales bacterium]|nr:tail fiber domain-containing protein [Bacteroidales bacterium]